MIPKTFSEYLFNITYYIKYRNEVTTIKVPCIPCGPGGPPPKPPPYV